MSRASTSLFLVVSFAVPSCEDEGAGSRTDAAVETDAAQTCAQRFPDSYSSGDTECEATTREACEAIGGCWVSRDDPARCTAGHNCE